MTSIPRGCVLEAAGARSRATRNGVGGSERTLHLKCSKGTSRGTAGQARCKQAAKSASRRGAKAARRQRCPAAKRAKSKPAAGTAGGTSAADTANPGDVLAPVGPLPALPADLTALSGRALNFLIGTFPVPPYLLPVYQAAAIDYGVPWQLLAAINEIETDFGRDLSVSSAGAVGWMQFLPSTWKRYGVAADGRGPANPYDPIDAIFSAARYLRAAGAGTDLPSAIFAYNHARWYVDSVELRARLLQILPQDLVDGLTGLMQAGFPVAGHLGADALAAPRAITIAGRPAAHIDAPPGAAVIAGADARIVAIAQGAQLGRYVTIEDAYGDRFTYAGLSAIPALYPMLDPRSVSRRALARQLGMSDKLAGHLPAATQLTKFGSAGTSSADSSSAGSTARSTSSGASAAGAGRSGTAATGTAGGASSASVAPLVKERLFADPTRPASWAAGGSLQLQSSVRSYLAAMSESSRSDANGAASDVLTRSLKLPADAFHLAPLRVGAVVVAGTVLGHVASSAAGSTGIIVQVTPAGSSQPIAAAPLVSGWQLLGHLTTGTNVLAGAGPSSAFNTRNPTLSQLVLGDSATLAQAVLADDRIIIDPCDRAAIAAGQVDHRVLAAIAYLAYSGLAPSVSGLVCGRPAGAGPRFEITALAGTPVLGHQQAGGLADLAERQLLALQGRLRPSRIISLRRYPWQSTALSLPDHAADIEVDYATSTAAAKTLSAAQWAKLTRRLGALSPAAASSS